MRPARALLAPREALPLDELPQVDSGAFRGACLDEVHGGAHLTAMWAWKGELFALFSRPRGGDVSTGLALVRTRVEGGSFPSLTPHLPQAQAFEREIAEEQGLIPDGHPWLKPLRRHVECGTGAAPHPFFRVEGSGIHEVAVGPVHAGVIEPGHFRFQCLGEEVLSLEIQLGYQSRGALPLLLRETPTRRLATAETIAGDTSVAHAIAYCAALEGLAQVEPPRRGEALRSMALELERLANHIGDLGALCNDVGYLPGASYFGRLRGDFLNLTAELCGSRFGRGLVVPGGVRFDLDAARAQVMAERLAKAARDCKDVAEMIFDTPLVVARFEGTGVVSLDTARGLGLVGPVARASGLARDVRHDHPRADDYAIPLVVCDTGDVMARALVRWREAEVSLARVAEHLEALPQGDIAAPMAPLRAEAFVATLVEGWRGEVAHVAVTDAAGAIADWRIVDPSFRNWFALAMALRGNAISDFPLCNKSFNLSYCGHDL